MGTVTGGRQAGVAAAAWQRRCRTVWQQIAVRPAGMRQSAWQSTWQSRAGTQGGSYVTLRTRGGGCPRGPACSEERARDRPGWTQAGGSWKAQWPWPLGTGDRTENHFLRGLEGTGQRVSGLSGQREPESRGSLCPALWRRGGVGEGRSPDEGWTLWGGAVVSPLDGQGEVSQEQ